MSGTIITVNARPKVRSDRILKLPSSNFAERSDIIDELISIPEGSKSKEQCLVAARESNQSLRQIPLSYLKDSEFCRKLMDNCQEPKRILSYLPMNMRTLEICVLAVAVNKEAIHYVPADKRDFCKRLI